MDNLFDFDKNYSDYSNKSDDAISNKSIDIDDENILYGVDKLINKEKMKSVIPDEQSIRSKPNSRKTSLKSIKSEQVKSRKSSQKSVKKNY